MCACVCVCARACACVCTYLVVLTMQVGTSCSGKSSVVHTLAQLTGHKLLEYPMNSDTDTTDLLGGFEQVIPLLIPTYLWGEMQPQCYVCPCTSAIP